MKLRHVTGSPLINFTFYQFFPVHEREPIFGDWMLSLALFVFRLGILLVVFRLGILLVALLARFLDSGYTALWSLLLGLGILALYAGSSRGPA